MKFDWRTLDAASIDEVLRDVCGVPDEAIAAARSGNKREFPCPKCGGTTRFRVVSPEDGAVFCSHCCTSKDEGSGDLIGAIQWAQGCSFKEALKILKERYAGTGDATEPVQTEYYYSDANGVARWRIVRSDFPDGRKKLSQSRCEKGIWKPGLAFDESLNCKAVPVPYRLPLVISPSTKSVYIVEGEKCADALNRLFEETGLGKERVATTNAGGSGAAKHWSTFARYVASDKDLYILGDDDVPGRKAVETILAAFPNRKVVAKFFAAPKTFLGKGYDVADWLKDRRAEGLAGKKLLDAFDAEVRTVDAEPEKNENFEYARFLMDFENETTTWLWENCVPLGAATVFAGVPGSGKSWLTQYLATALSLGVPLPNEDPQRMRDPIGTMFFRGEDPPYIVKRRVEQLGGRLDRICVFDHARDAKGREIGVDFSLVDTLDKVVKHMSKLAGIPIKLIVADPVSMFWPEGVDENKQNDVREALGPIIRWAENENVAILLVQHTRKIGSVGDSAPLSDRIMGSRSLVGAARVAWTNEPHPTIEGARVLRLAKTNCFDESEAKEIAWRIDRETGLFEVVDNDVKRTERREKEERQAEKEAAKAARAAEKAAKIAAQEAKKTEKALSKQTETDAIRNWIIGTFRKLGVDVEYGKRMIAGKFGDGKPEGFFGLATEETLYGEKKIRTIVNALGAKRYREGNAYYIVLPYSLFETEGANAVGN